MGIILLELYLGEKPWGDFTDLNELFVSIISFNPKKNLEEKKIRNVRVWGEEISESLPGSQLYDRLGFESMREDFRK